MNNTNPILLHQQKIQRITASNVSAWVSANAGSGKTYVLTQRVIRLLLSGVDPARILCLTYTKAAAAEMATRVFDALRRLVRLPEDELWLDIKGVIDVPPDAHDIKRARQAFAAALETPGGLKIQTIHAFCERILQQFPFEAPVPTGFTLLDEAATETLWKQAFNSTYALASQPGHEMQQHFRMIYPALGKKLESHVRTFLSRRGAMLGLAPAPAQRDAALRAALGIDAEMSWETLRAEVDTTGFLNSKFVHWLCEGFSNGLKTERKRIAILQRAINTQEFQRQLEILMELVEIGSGEVGESLAPTGIIKTKFSGHYLAYMESIERLLAVREQFYKFRCYLLSKSCQAFSMAVLQKFQACKLAQRALDFEDLIVKTRTLLTNADTAFVHFKLDGGIDHILLDEAQDTSPEQWDIIAQLAREFFVGEGARNGTRTLFVVGDDKQSIYRFQGAAPERFAEMKASFSASAKAARKPLLSEPLQISFRSTPDVLGVVDAVFSAQALAEGNPAVVHETQRRDAFGCVELWPLCRPEAREELRPIWEQGEASASPSAVQQLTGQIITAIQDLLTQPHVIADGAGQRRIVPGDILILVRKRKLIFEILLKGLRDANIPVAGADRLNLNAHIAVQDLLALVDALHVPQDDLQLACVLKSPLFGLSEDDVAALAIGRLSTLWEALRTRAVEHSAWGAAAAMLDGLMADIRTMRPYEFFAHILVGLNGRRLFAERLGADVQEILDEFLNTALAYEKHSVPSLTGFVQWMRDNPHELKRELAEAGNAVRIMTAHSAKGLEAPIVILAETCTPVRPQNQPKIVPVTHADMHLPLLAQNSAPPIVRSALEAIAAADSYEALRLLYVAMTRARDRLMIFGMADRNQENKLQKEQDIAIALRGTWYGTIVQGLAAWQGQVEDTGQCLRYRTSTTALINPQGDAGEVPVPVKPGQCVETVLYPLHAEAFTAVRIVAEQLSAGQGRKPSLQQDTAITNPQLRGVIIHKLLEMRLSEPQMQAFIRHMDPEGISGGGIVEEVQGVFAHPELREIWAADLYPEVPLVGQVVVNGQTSALSGRIDLLAKTGHKYVIVDFKTDSDLPEHIEALDPVYITQLQLYARLLHASVEPGAEISMCIVGTLRQHILWIPNAACRF